MEMERPPFRIVPGDPYAQPAPEYEYDQRVS
jgi:hypothetical protein